MRRLNEMEMSKNFQMGNYNIFVGLNYRKMCFSSSRGY